MNCCGENESNAFTGLKVQRLPKGNERATKPDTVTPDDSGSTINGKLENHVSGALCLFRKIYIDKWTLQYNQNPLEWIRAAHPIGKRVCGFSQAAPIEEDDLLHEHGYYAQVRLWTPFNNRSST